MSDIVRKKQTGFRRPIAYFLILIIIISLGAVTMPSILQFAKADEFFRYETSWSVPGIGDPISLDNDRNVYVADSIHHQLIKFNMQGEPVAAWGTYCSSDNTCKNLKPGQPGFNEIEGIAINRNSGDIYILDTGNAKVIQLNNKGTELRRWPVGVALHSVAGIAVSSTMKKVYVTDFDSSGNRISIYSLDGTFQSAIRGTAEHPLGTPIGVAVSQVGDIFILGIDSSGSGHVQVYDKDYNWVREWNSAGGTDLASPHGITVMDANGGPWRISVTESERLLRFDEQGNLLASWEKSGTEPGEFAFPAGVADDQGATWIKGSGMTYVVDTSNQKIQIYDKYAVVTNHRPVADAGDPQTVFPGDIVTLDGSSSYDEDGDQLTFSWTVPNSGITLVNEDTAFPSFRAPEVETDTDYTITLIVTDAKGLQSYSSSVSITVHGTELRILDARTERSQYKPGDTINAMFTIENSSPRDVSVTLFMILYPSGGSTEDDGAIFDNSANVIVNLPGMSTDQYERTLTIPSSATPGLYSIWWAIKTESHRTISKDVADSITISSSDTQSGDFTLDATPSSLNLSMETQASAISVITINSINGFSSSVTLDASSSSPYLTLSFDSNSLRPAADSSDSSRLTIRAVQGIPDGTYQVLVTGTSGDLSHSTELQVTVSSAPETNNPPTAIAYSPTLYANAGDTVYLDGSQSYDNDEGDYVTSYQWSQMGGKPTVSLEGADTYSPFFTAPDVSQDTQLMFRLKVTDSYGATGSDMISITILHSPGEQLQPFELSTDIDGNTYAVYGMEHNARPMDVRVNPNESLEFTIDDSQYLAKGHIEMHIPKEMASGITRISYYSDLEGVVDYGDIVMFQKSEVGDETILEFDVPEGTRNITVAAAQVVPEFPLSILIMATAVGASLAIMRMTRQIFWRKP